MATGGEFYCPSVGIFVAAYGQFFMAATINYQLWKISKTRGSFPSDEAAIKLAYLGIRNIEATRGGELGTGTLGWHQALNAFAFQFPNRLPI